MPYSDKFQINKLLFLVEIQTKIAAKLLLFFEICKFYSDFLKFAAVWSLSPGERKKKKKRTKRINKKRKPDPSTTVGGSTARMRVETPLKRHGGRSDYIF